MADSKAITYIDFAFLVMRNYATKAMFSSIKAGGLIRVALYFDIRSTNGPRVETLGEDEPYMCRDQTNKCSDERDRS